MQTADPFGEEITLAAKTAVVLKGSAKWDSAFETLTDSLKTTVKWIGAAFVGSA